MSLDNLKTLADDMGKLQAELIEKAKATFDVARNAFFAAHPEVYGFGWNQYTPSFNDGDACEFSRNEVVLFITEEDYENDSHCSEGVVTFWREDSPYWKNQITALKTEHPDLDIDQIVTDFKIVKNALESINDDLFLSTYGNNMAIIMTKEEIIEQDYDCGY